MGINYLMNYLVQHKLKRARDFETEGKFLHAIQIYNTIIAEFPEILEANIRLAELYERTENYQSAFKIYNHLVNTHPDNDDIAIYFAQFLIRRKSWQEAIDALKNVSPDDEPIVSFFIGYSYFQINEFELSKVHLLNFIISDEQPEIIHEAFLYLAKIEFEFQDFDSSKKYVKKASLLLSDNWELYFLKAKINYVNGSLTLAMKEINTALKLNNTEPMLYSWAGKICLKSQDYKLAESHFLKYLGLSETPLAENIVNLAKSQLKQKKFKDAISNYDEALKLDPENQELQNERKQILKMIDGKTA
jgi:tetratricopeptide (TPR) repeat protein